MNPQQIIDYIKAALAQSPAQSLITIVRTLAREAGINAASAAAHVVNVHRDMGTPLSEDASFGLHSQALDIDTALSAQQFGPRAIGIREGPDIVDPDYATIPEPAAAAGGYADPRTAQQIARERASLTYEGRQNIFGGFMGAQPGYGQYNPLVQQGISTAFGPLSAQFGLQSATDPYWIGEGNRAGIPSEPQTLDFRSFLKGTPQRWGQQEWINQLAPLGQAFSAGLGGTPDQLDLQAAYGSEAIQDRLMSAVLGQGVSPYLRRFVPGSIGQIRQRMFETDPSVDPFKQFLPSPLTWGT